MLTKEQVDQLFVFCKKHYVQYYDVQMELVDHLANAIEEKMSANKNVSFETALNSVYAGFGIKGFSDIVKVRIQMVGNRCRKMRRRIFFSYFTWPKAAMTACLLSILCILPKLFPGKIFFYLIFAITGLLWIYETRVFNQVRKLWKEQKQPLLMTGAGHDESFLTFYLRIQVLLPFFNYGDFFESAAGPGFWSCQIASIMIVSMFITTLAYKEFVLRLNEMARQQYPEAFAATG